MRLESIILAAATLIPLLTLLLVPKKNWIQAQFVFLFTQLPTWLFGLIVVERHLLEYPYRELSKVNSTSFIFEYLVLPIICVHFNAHFPVKATKMKKLLFYLVTSLIFTIGELILERYTTLIKYTGWEWYMTFLSVWFVLWLSKITTQWFFTPYISVCDAEQK